jgi:phenylalanyl-tRNA synthetase alpha subunit
MIQWEDIKRQIEALPINSLAEQERLNKEYEETSNSEELKEMNVLEKRIEELVDQFEKKYPGWTVEIDSLGIWGPTGRED